VRQLRDESPAPIFLVGFSLGGNVVMKLAGELGNRGPALLNGVCGVSTPLDLAACARRLAAPENRLYEKRFVNRMRARLSATGRYEPRDLAGLRSIREIDDRITAPSFGFGTAENYYRTQSALQYLDAIRVPTLFIQAQDDRLIPFDVFSTPALRANPLIELRATESGGHLGFLGCRPHRFWLDETIVEWLQSHSH
jgi:predicted alpha/beta-fold hydrolase